MKLLTLGCWYINQIF